MVREKANEAVSSRRKEREMSDSPSQETAIPNNAAAQKTNLVRQTDIERLLPKLKEMETINSRKRNASLADKHKDMAIAMFIKLCETHLGISEQQIKKLGKEEFGALEKIILQHAKSRKRWVLPSMLVIPIFGWQILLLDLYEMNTKNNKTSPSLVYVRSYRILKELCGEDFSLYPFFHGKKRALTR